MKTRIAGNPMATIRENVAFIEGVSIKDIVKKFGTPVFIYSENKIRNNCSNFIQILQKHFSSMLVLYSYKANFLPRICEIINSEGIGAEVVTSFELELALKSKVLPKKIHLGGVYLPDEALTLALKNKIGLISAVSLTQISKIGELTKKLDQKLSIGLRIVSPKFDRRIGFTPSAENFKKIVEILSKYPNLKATTLHSHYGTQNMKSSNYLDNANYLMNVMSTLEKFGIDIKAINLGGGFPETTTMTNSQLEDIGSGISGILKEAGWQDKQIIFEPGRYIVGDAGMLLTKVIDVKHEKEQWVYVDAGTNNCPIWANNNLRIFCANKISQPNITHVNIAGPLPTYMDVLAKRTPFIEKVEVDDILMILNVGAYNLSWGTFFSFPQPPFILIKDAEMIELRARKHPSFIL